MMEMDGGSPRRQGGEMRAYDLTRFVVMPPFHHPGADWVILGDPYLLLG